MSMIGCLALAMVVWIRQQMSVDRGKDVAHLHMSDPESGESFPLTRGKFTHSAAKWSPDGAADQLSKRSPSTRGEEGIGEDATLAYVRQEAAKFSLKAPLLKAVGSFAGLGENADVFDLRGNAAEWNASEAGGYELREGSGDQSAKGQSEKSDAGHPYRGFRVVFDIRADDAALHEMAD